MPDFSGIRPAYPARLEAANCRVDGRDGEVHLVIANARHFQDVADFARSIDRVEQFTQTLTSLIGIALGYATSYPPSSRTTTKPDGTEVKDEFPARPGRTIRLRLNPDWPSERTPSFGWAVHDGDNDRLIMNGGCIFHSADGEWTLHS